MADDRAGLHKKIINYRGFFIAEGPTYTSIIWINEYLIATL